MLVLDLVGRLQGVKKGLSIPWKLRKRSEKGFRALSAPGLEKARKESKWQFFNFFFGFVARLRLFFELFWPQGWEVPEPFSDVFQSFMGRVLFYPCRRPTMSQVLLDFCTYFSQIFSHCLLLPNNTHKSVTKIHGNIKPAIGCQYLCTHSRGSRKSQIWMDKMCWTSGFKQNTIFSPKAQNWETLLFRPRWRRTETLFLDKNAHVRKSVSVPSQHWQGRTQNSKNKELQLR